MTFLRFALLAAGSLLGFVAGVPVPYTHSPNPHTKLIANDVGADIANIHIPQLTRRGTADVYMMYTGNGQQNWPDQSSWLDFPTIFAQNLAIIKDSCVQWNVPLNSDQEIEDMRVGVQKVAAETGLDDRFILAVLLQESNGCVRAPTTNNGVRNPGLMQDHNGEATCNEGGHVQIPCPSATIEQMIRDGAAGTAAGDGLVQTYAQAPGYGTAKYYGAARIYNSGSIAASGDLGEGIATHCYASDIANRLMGWAHGQKSCSLDGAPAIAAPTPPAYEGTAPPAPAPPRPYHTCPSQNHNLSQSMAPPILNRKDTPL